MKSQFRVPKHVRSVIDPDGAVILDLKRGAYFSLNGVAAEIWTQLEAGLAVSEIEAHLRAAYEVPAVAVRHDVTTFIAHLEKERLIHAGE